MLRVIFFHMNTQPGPSDFPTKPRMDKTDTSHEANETRSERTLSIDVTHHAYQPFTVPSYSYLQTQTHWEQRVGFIWVVSFIRVKIIEWGGKQKTLNDGSEARGHVWR